MKTRRSSLFLGLALIIVGILAFINDLSFFQRLPAATWMLIFASASALFLVTYFVRGLRAWGWLFPASIFAGLSGTMFISSSPVASEWIPTLVVGSVAIPFMAAFLLDRSRTWALIPAFVLGLIAFIPPLNTLIGSDVMGGFIVAMLGLPFIIANFMTPKVWWGIIPGGIFFSIAAMVALTHFINSDISVAVMFLGWTLTFGYLWLRQAREWAKYPAMVMGILACLMLLISKGLENYWAIGLIVAGLVVIFLILRPRHSLPLK